MKARSLLGLLDRHALDIGPGIQKSVLAVGHLRDRGRSRSARILPSLGFRQRHQRLRQREAGPGHGHRPCFDAAVPVEPRLQRNFRTRSSKAMVKGFSTKPVDRDLPRADDEVLRVGGDVLARPELVEIVVVAVDLLGRDRAVELVGLVLLGGVEVGRRVGIFSACQRDAGTQRGRPWPHRAPKPFENRPAIHVDRLRRRRSAQEFPRNGGEVSKPSASPWPQHRMRMRRDHPPPHHVRVPNGRCYIRKRISITQPFPPAVAFITWSASRPVSSAMWSKVAL